VEYPIGHRRRREEGIPLLEQKFRTNLATRFPGQTCRRIDRLCADQQQLEQTAVPGFLDLFVI
jgi:2-methylcitrate dehydratase